MRQPPQGFPVAFDFSAPVNIEEVLRTLRPATVKGFVISDMLRAAEKQGKALPNAPSFVAFKDYSFHESFTISFQIARHLYPHLPLREGLRRLGHRAYGSLLESTLGRAMFGLVGMRMETMMKIIPQAHRAFQKGGAVELLESTPESAHFAYRNFPYNIDSYQIGMYEGGFLARGKKHAVYLKTLSFGEAEIFCSWEGA
jgi:uncharacterized protein (TIGR02265 family)